MAENEGGPDDTGTGVVADLIWARVERAWPFGPKLVRETYLDQQRLPAACACREPRTGNAPGDIRW
jgi:hypothetical protein